MKTPILAGAALLAVAIALTPAQATETVTYTYDERGRLITSSSTGTVNNNQTVAIAYDAADNRSNFAVTGIATPSLSIAGASATEVGNLVFTVTLTPAATGTVSVQYATAAGTASASINPDSAPGVRCS